MDLSRVCCQGFHADHTALDSDDKVSPRNADMRIAFDANSWMTSKKFCSKRVIAHSLPHLATTHTTTGNVTAASSVPSATAPDTGFTSR
ncbi:hypothetical protein ACVWZV_002984 [Bradyrhizobium sp. GM5.1]